MLHLPPGTAGNFAACKELAAKRQSGRVDNSVQDKDAKVFMSVGVGHTKEKGCTEQPLMPE